MSRELCLASAQYDLSPCPRLSQNHCSYVKQGTEIAAVTGIAGRAGRGWRSRRWKWRARCRLRHLRASMWLLPSASLRWRYALVVGSRRACVIAMMCSAWFMCRLPPRCSRWRSRLPEDAGIGATPAMRTKCALVGNRCAPGVWPIRIAALIVPHPTSASSSGQCGDQTVQFAFEQCGLAGELADHPDLLFGDPHAC